MEVTQQTAEVSSFSGTAQIIRDGFFLPIEPGMQLQPGDRVSTDAGATVVIHFTGVSQPLVIQNGSAATLYQDTTVSESAPQWMVADMYGDQVYFAETDSEVAQGAGSETFHGLFYTGEDNASFPILETAAAVAAGAFIISEYDDNDDSTPATTATAQTSADGNADSSTDASTSGSDTQADASASDTSVDLGPLADVPGADQLASGLGMVDSALNDALLADTPLQSPIGTITSALSDGGNALPIPTDGTSLPV